MGGESEREKWEGKESRKECFEGREEGAGGRDKKGRERIKKYGGIRGTSKYWIRWNGRKKREK